MTEQHRFRISSDVEDMDLDAVHAFLAGSYWARDIPKQLLAKAIRGSLCFGVFEAAAQVGFARVVTDFATFAYLCDVYVLERTAAAAWGGGSWKQSWHTPSSRACDASFWQHATRTGCTRNSVSPRSLGRRSSWRSIGRICMSVRDSRRASRAWCGADARSMPSCRNFPGETRQNRMAHATCTDNPSSMPQEEFSSLPTLQPTRSSDGQRSSVMLEVRGHPFQAVFVCLPTGELSDAAIHGTRADPMTPEQRIELETEARAQAARLKEKHGAELLAGMSVVRVDELLQCVSDAPPLPTSGDEHRLAGWDALTGADEARTPPLAHPVLSASDYQGQPTWRFWGTLDVQVASDASTQDLADQLKQSLGARAVSVLSIWLGRPEIHAFF